jgi:hypothetical protein
MEVPLANYLKKRWSRPTTPDREGFDFHACVALLHHHGSKQSTFGDFINFFNPRLAVCSAKGDSPTEKRFPSRLTITRFKEKGALVPLYTDNESTPDRGSYGPSEPRGPLGPSTLLFTSRVDVGSKKSIDVFDDLDLIRRETWRHAIGQDIIIEVTEEKGHSPLVSKEYPRMRASRRLRDVETYKPVNGVLEPLDGFDQGVTCMVPPGPLPSRSHEILELLPKGKTP